MHTTQLRKCAVVIAVLGLSAPAFAQTAGTGTSVGANIGATGTNETAGTSSPGVKAQGSGSADLNTNRPSSPDRATGQERAEKRKSDSAKDSASTGASGTAGAGGNIGATGTNETAGNSSAGVKAQGSGSGGADMGSNRGK